MKLGWLVDGESSKHRAHPHQDDARVGDPLRIVELLRRRRTLDETQIVQHDLNCPRKRVPRRYQITPLAREDGKENIRNSIEGKKPHEEEVVRQTLCKLEF